jgi:hypothetical protein
VTRYTKSCARRPHSGTGSLITMRRMRDADRNKLGSRCPAIENQRLSGTDGSNLSLSDNRRRSHGGTKGSNPSPSSGESVSRGTLSSWVKNPGFRAGFLAAFSARSAESRRARQYRTNLRQYLCRAIFQYRISGDAQSRQVVGLKSQASPNEVGLLWLRDAGGFCECGITLKQIRAQSADRARQAADGNAQAASPPSDRAAAVLR